MNKLRGKVSQVTTSGAINLVDIDVSGTQMTAIILGTPKKFKYLRTSQAVELLFNESEVSIGRMAHGQISLNNQLPCVVEDFVPGEILTQVILSFNGERLTSLITTRSVKRLNLKVEDRVMAFIKTTELLLKEPDGTLDAD